MLKQNGNIILVKKRKLSLPSFKKNEAMWYLYGISEALCLLLWCTSTAHPRTAWWDIFDSATAQCSRICKKVQFWEFCTVWLKFQRSCFNSHMARKYSNIHFFSRTINLNSDIIHVFDFWPLLIWCAMQNALHGYFHRALTLSVGYQTIKNVKTEIEFREGCR